MSEPSIIERDPPAAAAVSTGMSPITAVPRTVVRSGPATASQEGLWLLHHAVEQRYVYNCPFAFRLHGALDVRAAEDAFAALIQRHESLRSVFASIDGQLVQTVRAQSSFALARVDLSERAPAQAESALAQLAEANSMQVFDLERGPLMRATLVRLAADAHVLLIALHHIVFDEWSNDIFIEEFGSLYAICARHGDVADCAPPPLQFIDHAVRQRAAEGTPARQRQLAYWRRKLAGAARPVILPADRQPDAEHPDFRGAHEHFTLDAANRDALETIARREYSPPVAVLIAALALTLHRYTRERDLNLGYLVSGRLMPETESMMGLCVNSLVMRVDLRGDPSFVELLRRVRDLAFEAYSNQEVAFQQVVRELNPTREADGHPLFRTCVNYHPAARRALAMGEALRTEPLTVPDVAQFELLLDAHPNGDGCIECHLEYRTAMFDAATVRRFARHYCNLLANCLRAPDEPVSRADMLTRDEQQRLLHAWNDTARDYDLQARPTDLLAALARATPDHDAIVFGGRRIGYAEFDRLTDGVAAFLQQRGVGAETMVGLCADASIDMIVGMFGILKAGAAYLALPPEDPPERLAYMLGDARPSFVLTQARHAPRFAAYAMPLACLDRDAAHFAAAGKPDAAQQRDPQRLAYLMYTSGSTGKPKAVAIAWASLLNHVASFREASGLRAADRCMLFSSYAFDGSVEEIYAPLLTGATLVIHPERPIPIDTLESLVVEHRLTFLDFTAGYWNVWLELLLACRRQIPEPVRQVVIGGEMIRANQLRGWDRVDRGGEVQLLITYGPTESTVIATAMPYRRSGANDASAPVDGYLGRPLGNLAVHVLDDGLRPVPIGAVGDVYIAGPNLARGYVGAPALTAERFMPDPHAATPGGRMYRTGDLARRLADGTLQYQGRADNQVKFRGFRIEPGEIDRTLALFPHAQAAVTTIAAAPNGDPTLVAFVMPEGGHELDADAIRRFVGGKLPAYMVPERIEVLRTFPVKASGKTDLAKLVEQLAWSGAAAAMPVLAATPALAPAPATEHDPQAAACADEIAAIFTGLLKRGSILPQDNFFKVGGHSLLALQALSHIRQSQGVQIPMKEFYLTPTAAGLAEIVARLKQGGAGGPEAARKAPTISRIRRTPSTTTP
ncbi:MAG: amino acid adenylation domain-containing protein [Proteobacteria bacterium]|nr:amino acid adenylation domain-containing protein [Pseudomonadota bacterium]